MRSSKINIILSVHLDNMRFLKCDNFLLNFIATLGTCIYTQTINGTNIFLILNLKRENIIFIHTFTGPREVADQSRVEISRVCSRADFSSTEVN